jgi:3-hydroxyisobutyrate dehydrogenase
MQKSVGFIGAGLMGSQMMRRLLATGQDVVVWNRSAWKLRPLIDLGARQAGSPAELAAGTGATLICVSDTPAVETVVFGERGVAESIAPGGLLIDLSSIRPDATRAMAARLDAERRAAWVDAPVTGGVTGAINGTLIIMAGGAEAAVEQARTYLAPLSQRLTRMGSAGAGQTTKLCNQILGGCTLVALAEMTRFGLDAGIDAARLPECLAGGLADSRLLQLMIPRLLADPPLPPTAHARTILKDLDSACEIAHEKMTALPMTGLSAELFRALARHDPEADQTAIVTLFDRLASP